MKLNYPDDLVIGLKFRRDSMVEKLSYICYKEKNKIRKEKSLNDWRDKNIDLLEIKNKPKSGFLVSKSVRRDGGSFGSGRSLMRIHDPDGYDFEISIENLEYILQYCDVNKGEFIGEFVYMWLGKELYLIPVDSGYYMESMKLKNDKAGVVKASDLKIASTYKDKKTDDFYIYLGRHDYHDLVSPKEMNEYFKSVGWGDSLGRPHSISNKSDWKYYFGLPTHVDKAKKSHVFYDSKKKDFVTNIQSKLSYELSDDSEEYPDLIEEYKLSKYGSKTIGIDFKSLSNKQLKDEIKKLQNYKGHYFSKSFKIALTDDICLEINLNKSREDDEVVFDFSTKNVFIRNNKTNRLEKSSKWSEYNNYLNNQVHRQRYFREKMWDSGLLNLNDTSARHDFLEAVKNNFDLVKMKNNKMTESLINMSESRTCPLILALLSDYKAEEREFGFYASSKRLKALSFSPDQALDILSNMNVIEPELKTENNEK